MNRGKGMAFSFSQCRSVLLQGILDALDDRATEIASIEQIQNVEFPVSGISVDMAPWHGAVGLSLRLASEFEWERRYSHADWDYFDLVFNTSFPGLQTAGRFICQ